MNLNVTLRAAALFAAAATLAAAQDNALTSAEKASGWKLLFDGKTYKGWIDPEKKVPAGGAWAIQDGCLVPQRKAHIREDLVSKDQYDDFELVFDWKISPGGNSGVKYRIQDFVLLADPDAAKKKMKFEDVVETEYRERKAVRARIPAEQYAEEYVVGFEFQVIDNGKHSDALRGPLYQAGALYAMIPPVKPAALPVGEWNHGRILVKGDRIEHWLNGEKVVDSSLADERVTAAVAKRWGADSGIGGLLSKRPRRRCPISLQNHGDEAWFRNLKIRELK